MWYAIHLNERHFPTKHGLSTVPSASPSLRVSGEAGLCRRFAANLADLGFVVTGLSTSVLAEELDGGRPSEEALGPRPHDGAGD